MIKLITALSFGFYSVAFAENINFGAQPDFSTEFTQILSSEPKGEAQEILEMIGRAELEKMLAGEPTEELKQILVTLGAAKLKRATTGAMESPSEPMGKGDKANSPLTSGSVEAEFTQALSPQKPKKISKEMTAQTILNIADTHISESNYGAALDVLGENPDGTAEWYEVYGSAAMGDRQQSKALEAFTKAKELYEAQGNESKVNQMNAMINALTPR